MIYLSVSLSYVINAQLMHFLLSAVAVFSSMNIQMITLNLYNFTSFFLKAALFWENPSFPNLSLFILSFPSCCTKPHYNYKRSIYFPCSYLCLSLAQLVVIYCPMNDYCLQDAEDAFSCIRQTTAGAFLLVAGTRQGKVFFPQFAVSFLFVHLIAFSS